LTNQADDTPTKRVFLGIPLSETLLLAGASFVAYVLTFVYQAGYFDTFGIPRQLISLTLVDVLSIGSKIVGVFVAILVFLNFLSIFLPRQINYPLRRRILQILPLFLFIVPWLFFYEWGRDSVIVALLMIFLVLIMFLPPLFEGRDKGGYLQKMEALDSRLSASYPWEGSLLSRLADVVGVSGFMVIMYFLLSANLAYNAGKASAVNQKIFLVANTSPEGVVLFMTSDRLITAPIVSATKEIVPSFTVINLTKDSAITLRSVKLGPLRLFRSVGAKPGASTGRPPALPRPNAGGEAAHSGVIR
jgi:hypothetical protein